MYHNCNTYTGPLDIVGDIHSCYDELIELITKLGYEYHSVRGLSHPQERKLVFVGDLFDRGPKPKQMLEFLQFLDHTSGIKFVLGNHDDKLRRYLLGNKVSMRPEFEETVNAYHASSTDIRREVKRILDSTPYYITFDNGKLLVAHAGLKADLHGLETNHVRSFCTYGDVDGSKDERGFPIRRHWEYDYDPSGPMIVFGHTPTLPVTEVNNTVNVDTGCAFGGYLTALRYPEKEIVQVHAHEQYATPTYEFAEMLHRDSMLIKD